MKNEYAFFSRTDTHIPILIPKYISQRRKSLSYVLKNAMAAHESGQYRKRMNFQRGEKVLARICHPGQRHRKNRCSKVHKIEMKEAKVKLNKQFGMNLRWKCYCYNVTMWDLNTLYGTKKISTIDTLNSFNVWKISQTIQHWAFKYVWKMSLVTTRAFAWDSHSCLFSVLLHDHIFLVHVWTVLFLILGALAFSSQFQM